MNTMSHQGYIARVEFDERDNIFVGRVLGIRTMISFHGETVAGLRSEFETAVDDFVREYKDKGLKPETPASGKLLLRVPPEVHGAALVAAQAAGKGLNQWATELLQDAVRHGAGGSALTSNAPAFGGATSNDTSPQLRALPQGAVARAR